MMSYLLLGSILPEFEEYLAIYNFLAFQWLLKPRKN